MGAGAAYLRGEGRCVSFRRAPTLVRGSARTHEALSDAFGAEVCPPTRTSQR